MRNQASAFQFSDFHPQPADMLSEIVEGLQQQPRYLAAKFFYDEAGSHLFDQICQTDAYYPTRTETQIIRDHIDDIGACIGTGCLLVEPGSGNSRKVRELLDAIQPHAYLPMDISRGYLKKEAQKLHQEYPWLQVHAICTDYTNPVDIPGYAGNLHRVAFFPGSSIGNFEPKDAVDFLRNIRDMVGPNGGLLIGVDLKKSVARLVSAYNDPDGFTAEFNLNMLTRINREIGADFALDKFEHAAFYNINLGRIEMHLISLENQVVHVGAHEFSFQRYENIHTENSYKYTVEEFQALGREAGFEPQRVWTDDLGLFSLHYFS